MKIKENCWQKKFNDIAWAVTGPFIVWPPIQQKDKGN